jgi:RNA processing factor Prp31
LFDGKVENASEVANRIGQFKRPDPPDILLDQAIFDAHFVVKMAERCRSLQSDLRKKLYNIAPNLTELVGELIAARFIKKACD